MFETETLLQESSPEFPETKALINTIAVALDKSFPICVIREKE